MGVTDGLDYWIHARKSVPNIRERGNVKTHHLEYCLRNIKAS